MINVMEQMAQSNNIHAFLQSVKPFIYIITLPGRTLDVLSQYLILYHQNL